MQEISILSKSGHLEWRAGLMNTILKGSFQRSLVNFGEVGSEE
jgi:hypothetical protein